MKTEVQDYRTRAIAFIKSMGGQAGRSEIKTHLGLNPVDYWPSFDRAMRTKKLVPIFGDGQIAPGLFLARPPIVAYRIA